MYIFVYTIMKVKKRKKRISKVGDFRDISINVRISKDELLLLDGLCTKRKICGSHRWSRTDVLIDAIKFADVQLTSIIL